MNKLLKRKSAFLVAIVAILAIMCSLTTGFASASLLPSQNYPTIYNDVATNFLKCKYEQLGIEHEDFSIVLESDMYSTEDTVVAKALVASRGGQYDYVILNIATSEIDEYAFNDEGAFEKFSDKVYYTGLLNYYTKEGATYTHFNNTKISQSDFNKNSSRINDCYKKTKKNASKKMHSDNNPLPNPTKDGWNGFYSWSDISAFNNKNGYSNTDYNYLQGIGWNDIKASGLSFYNQTTFNSYFGTNNSCGPTALTNMFVWFQYKNATNKNGEVKALLNGNAYDTFSRFRTLSSHSNTDGTYSSKYPSALKNYAKEQGYNYNISGKLNSFNSIKANIDKNYPIITSLQLSGWGGHAVLTVGYEVFSQAYTVNHQFLFVKWTTTEYKYTRYLRVIDGWSTSNSSRFIDFSGYWDSINGYAFNIGD